MIYEITVQIRVADFEQGRKWYTSCLRVLGKTF